MDGSTKDSKQYKDWNLGTGQMRDMIQLIGSSQLVSVLHQNSLDSPYTLVFKTPSNGVQRVNVTVQELIGLIALWAGEVKHSHMDTSCSQTQTARKLPKSYATVFYSRHGANVVQL